jgi:hypothetical protein
VVKPAAGLRRRYPPGWPRKTTPGPAMYKRLQAADEAPRPCHPATLPCQVVPPIGQGRRVGRNAGFVHARCIDVGVAGARLPQRQNVAAGRHQLCNLMLGRRNAGAYVYLPVWANTGLRAGAIWKAAAPPASCDHRGCGPRPAAGSRLSRVRVPLSRPQAAPAARRGSQRCRATPVVQHRRLY